MVLEVGLLLVDRNKMDNEVKYAIRYALKLNTIDENKIETNYINL